MCRLDFRQLIICAIILVFHKVVRMVTDFHNILRYSDIKHSIEVMFEPSSYCLL